MTALERLVAERNPSVAQLLRERDPRAEDAQFYTGLGWVLVDKIQRELDAHARRTR